MTQVIDLAQQLISIPSWVGNDCDEQKVGEFIYAWLRANTQLTIIKQPVQNGRFNVIAYDTAPTRQLLVGHMDTVTPRAGWETDPLAPVVQKGRLYGLGSTDMKGSLAAGMIALSRIQTRGVMFLAYCDEEYDFAGMHTFIAEYQDKLKPQQIISLDGSADQVGIGCRGLIEVNFRLRGKTGHAGRPKLGVNAITSGIGLINNLERQLISKYSDPILGSSTLNLAYCQGGLDTGTGQYGRQGNNIADLAEFVLDIRAAKPDLTAQTVKQLIQSYLPGSKLKLENWAVRHDLGSWLTEPNDLTKLNVSGQYEPSLGYIDTQMLWRAFDKVSCCTIGAGNLELAHTANEYVEVRDLEKTLQNVSSLLKGGYND